MDGREKDPAAGLDQPGAGLHDRARLRHVFQHLHASDDVEALGLLGGQRLGADLAIFHAARRSLQRVQLGHLESLVGQVDAKHVATAARHGIGEDSAAAAHVKHPASCHGCNTFDPLEAEWINFMERPEFTFQIPPPVSQL